MQMKRNRRQRVVAACVAGVLGLACVGMSLASSGAPDVARQGRTAAPAHGRGYEEGVVLVGLDKDTTANQALTALDASGVARCGDVEDAELGRGLLRVELKEGVRVSEAVERLAAQEHVTSVQPNYTYLAADAHVEDDVPLVATVPTEESAPERAATPEDALVAASTSVSDPHASDQWALGSMGVFDAWDSARVDQTVTVAALDLGCDVYHEDLAANLLPAYNAYNAVHGGDVTDVTPIASNFNHGTHVAGIIGAVTDNGIGVAGTSFNARVLPIKVVDEAGNAFTDVLVAAYDYVLDHADEYNIRVINLSMGSKVTALPDNAFTEKIQQAWSRGIVTVSAAGNVNEAAGWIAPFVCYPSDISNVVSVINLQQAGAGVDLAPASNYNAPGHQDKNISAPGSKIFSTTPNNHYSNLSGTSMACPQVSSVLAMEFAVAPSLSADAAVDILYQTATDLGAGGFDERYGWGEVNAAAAVAAAQGGQVTQNSRWQRLFGESRYQTMEKIVAEGFQKSSWATLTTGENFPDALCASALAGAKQCPVLITSATGLSPECDRELTRLGVTDVYLVGGTSAVSEDTARALTARGIRVQRVAGADRQGTSIAALQAVEKCAVPFDTVVVCTGASFPDSLSISPWVWCSHSPILLTNSDGTLSEAALQAIAGRPSIRRAIICGGEAAVSAACEKQLANVVEVVRLAGANRYETSAEIVRWETKSGLTWANPSVATGQNFPDALCGAALAGVRSAPILLVHAAGDATVQLAASHAQEVTRGYVLGGTQAVGDVVVGAL